MRYLLRTLFLLIALFIVTSSYGVQRGSYNKHPFLAGFSIAPHVGANYFFGDLVNDRPITPFFGITSEKEVTEYLNARLDISGGMLSGTQINPTNSLPFAKFNSTYISFQAGVAFHPIPLIYGFYKQRKFKPYVVGQIGMIAYDATEKFGEGAGYDFFADGTPVLSGDVWHSTDGFKVSPMFSLGGGLNYYISKKWSASIEFISAMPLTDLLDAHEEWDSGVIVDPSGPQTKTKSSVDFFYTGSVGIAYTFAESKFRNQFKYNRKSYLKTRKSMTYKKTKTIKTYNKKNKKR